jgi:IS5 family transposase
MRKDMTRAKITKVQIKRNRRITKKRYIIEQYFGLSHLHHGAHHTRYTVMFKNIWDAMCRQMAFILFRGSRLIAEI